MCVTTLIKNTILYIKSNITLKNPWKQSKSMRKKVKQYPFVDEALPLIDGIIKHTVDTQNGVVTATAETFFA